MLTRNLFTRLDGSAVALLGKNWDATVTGNDFEWLGGSAVVLWGRTSSRLNSNGTLELPWSDYPNGPDGRDRDVPLRVSIVNNTAHDLGMWQKQSSFLFQAVSAMTKVLGNVVRAHTLAVPV